MKTNHAADVCKLNVLSECWFLLVFSFCCFQLGRSEYYESVQWTSRNPMFQFSNETIQGGRAYHRLSVLPSNKLIFICPNPSTYLSDKQKPITYDQLYENLWYVDKQSFQACQVGGAKGKGINSRLLKCDTPNMLNYHGLVFRHFSADTPLSFPPGTEHYFIATSDGWKNSLNSTSGGHCKDTKNGISMKMIIYICYNDTDPACNVKTDPPTTTPVDNGTTQKPEIATQASRTSSPYNIWHVLAIIFAVGLAFSLVIHSICLFVVCHSKTAKKSAADERVKLHPQTKENGLENVDANLKTVTCTV